MRIIHTADWHLGKKLEQNDRIAEHELFFEWLLKTIVEHHVEALVVAGDIFDTGFPANETVALYFGFLRKLMRTSCRQVVIVGGNHDSVSTLNAPRELLKAFDITVIGGVTEDPNEQIVLLKNQQGETEAVVVAVPFLRDRDVRLSMAGESMQEKEERLKAGIVAHYAQFVPLVAEFKNAGLPILTTGHLYAAGCEPSDSEKDIHVGNLGKVAGSSFAPEFDYVALGHLHRPQIVGGMAHIRYSGSPIALSFSEAKDEKQVLLLETSINEPVSITPLPIPIFRSLRSIKGNEEKVINALKALPNETENPLPTWVEVQVNTDALIIGLQEKLEEIIAEKTDVEKIFLRQYRIKDVQGITANMVDYQHLNEMTPQQVFSLRCNMLGTTEKLEELNATFSEALQLMEEKP